MAGWVTISVTATAEQLPRLSDLRAERATSESREDFLAKMEEETIGLGLAEPLYDKTEEKWHGALWATQLARYRSRHTWGGIKGCLGNFSKISTNLQRQALETAYGVFPGEFTDDIGKLLSTIDDPKIFAMAVIYLTESKEEKTSPATFARIMEQRFPDWRSNPVLRSLKYDLEHDSVREVSTRPALEDLFSAPELSGRPVIFSLHRVDRTRGGIALVRDADGRFARNGDGSLFHIPHLALAASNLPGYITNGNSPEGIMSIIGTGISENVFIGPTPFLHSILPNEKDSGTFLHEDSETGRMDLDEYRTLLPESWRGYRPFEEAWYAGEAGRSEIILHGTTINPEYYRDEIYYPNTPSLGCLTATEMWSPTDGRAVRSDQLLLLQTYMNAGGPLGWLVIIDIDAKKLPVTLMDVADAIEASEES